MAEFAIFVAKQRGAFDRQALAAFYQSNQKKMSEALGETINGLDANVRVTVAPATVGGTDYLPLPKTRQDRAARWAALSGKGAADLAWPKVAAFVELLEGLENIFDPSKTGAFEVGEDRKPTQNARFQFATAKFVTDHVCNITNTTDPKMKEEAETTAHRRMTKQSAMGPPTRDGKRPLEFTNITTSSLMDLHQQKRRDELDAEITSRQKEFEAIYKYLTSQGKREQILLQGDHEEVIFTSTKKFNFYEAVRPNDPNDPPPVSKYSENHLRYAVQKVGERWLLHHMAGRATPGGVNTAPNASYQAFNYANLNGVAAVPGTFSKVD